MTFVCINVVCDVSTALDWDLLNKFTSEVGWDLIFDLNVLLREGGRWNPSNAIELLKYTITRGYNVSVFELGNGKSLSTVVLGINVYSGAGSEC